jgi:hypothetical protein
MEKRKLYAPLLFLLNPRRETKDEIMTKLRRNPESPEQYDAPGRKLAAQAT